MGITNLISCLLLLIMFSGSSAAPDGSVHNNDEDGGGVCKSMVDNQNYPCEEHNVTTYDGYVLSLQRISSDHAGRSPSHRQPVLLQHGLMMDAASWLLAPPTQSLPYLLADNGFDVWISSSRGTEQSRRHKILLADSPDYWDWSWDELAACDLTAMVHHVQRTTSQKLHYVGHSLGTTLVMAELSEGRLTQSLRSAALLSPIAYLGRVTSVLVRLIADRYLPEILHTLGVYELNLNSEIVSRILTLICDEPNIDCTNLLTAFTGPNCCVKPSVMDKFLAHEPQPTSTKNLIHLAQMIRSGKIAKYDYKSYADNSRRYGQPTPPLYNLKNIPRDFPLFLAYGGADQLSEVNGVRLLIKDLKRHIRDKLIITYIPNYGHADLVIAENANKLVFDPLMSFFKRH
uniref:Lipase n=1 Tax=Kalanchoe fedtschenkoi TaxID=63787 RepID=A0A7N0RIS0_KALFE